MGGDGDGQVYEWGGILFTVSAEEWVEMEAGRCMSGEAYCSVSAEG